MPKPLTLVQKALRELIGSIRFIALVHGALSGLIAFCVALLLVNVLTINWLYAFLSFPVSAWLFYRTLRHANVYLVEKILPEFKDRLITVRDTATQDNEVIRSLHEETIAKMKLIKNSYFIEFGAVTIKIVSLMVLCFTIVAFAAFNVRFLDLGKAVQALPGLRPLQSYTGLNQSLLKYTENMSQEIYGNKSIAELGLEQIQLQIHPLDSDIDINDVKDAEKKEFKDEVVAQEIVAVNDVSYEENIPREYQSIVKTYFNGIAKSG